MAKGIRGNDESNVKGKRRPSIKWHVTVNAQKYTAQLVRVRAYRARIVRSRGRTLNGKGVTTFQTSSGKVQTVRGIRRVSPSLQGDDVLFRAVCSLSRAKW